MLFLENASIILDLPSTDCAKIFFPMDMIFVATTKSSSLNIFWMSVSMSVTTIGDIFDFVVRRGGRKKGSCYSWQRRTAQISQSLTHRNLAGRLKTFLTLWCSHGNLCLSPSRVFNGLIYFQLFAPGILTFGTDVEPSCHQFSLWTKTSSKAVTGNRTRTCLRWHKAFIVAAKSIWNNLVIIQFLLAVCEQIQVPNQCQKTE